MAVETRKRSKLSGSGPFLAEVTNLLDPTFMGNLEVSLIKGVPSSVKLQAETFVVRYMSPFYGVTSIRYEGNSSGAFSDVQKSYGMWMIPPDIGTTVMVIFIDGDPNQGYWIGCVPDMYQNHMVPGLAASRYSAITDEQKRKYGTDYLPVAEFHKASRKLDDPNVDKFNKPVHPFADRLVQQGLLLDFIRGVTSSGARREAPSSVFGISTPGPLDKKPGAKTGPVGYQGNIKSLPVSRLGGSTFVMDDGDSEGQNELVRIRTRTGHQILMHNSHDLIYIANSKGTAWIELTSNGKIDIYAQDSVSIHSKFDFNFLADRDINLEAGRNIRIKASGDMDTNVVKNCNFIVGGDHKIAIQGDQDQTIAKNLKLTIGDNYNLSVINDIKQTSGAGFDISAGGEAKIGASSNLNLGSAAEILASASRIHLNGPGAAVPEAAEPATVPENLPVFSLPNRIKSEGWENGKFYKATDIVTIMKRAPTHEPWDHHENINSDKFSPDSTDVSPSKESSSGRITPLTNLKPKPETSSGITYSAPAQSQGTPPTPTGNVEQDNIAAFLWMIRVCEGTSGPNGYRTMFTGKLFDIDDPNSRSYQYRDHPRIANRGAGITSTAAGAYQFLSTTWDECQRILKLPDFSPESQDKAAVFLLQRRKALDDIKKGNFTEAIKKTNLEWASLPGSPYNQNPKSYETALALYKNAGGNYVS